MKKLLFFVSLLLILNTASSQIMKRIGDRVKQKAGQKMDEKVDKTIDNATDGKKKEDKTNNDDNTANTGNSNNTDIAAAGNDNDKSKGSSATLVFNSKYDFVPGEKVIAYEDFNNTAIGDFPTRWNTNATAEVVTINNKEGKWLKLSKEGVWHPEFITNLPDNFTLEFDLAVNNGWGGTHFAVNIAKLNKPQDFTDYYHFVAWKGNYAVHMQLKPGQSGRSSAYSKLQAGSTGEYAVNNDVDFKGWDNASQNFAHISMWRQGQRLRVYANGE